MELKDFRSHEEITVVAVAQLIEGLKEQYDNGEMSRGEFEELVNDLTDLEKVETLAVELERKVAIRNGLKLLKEVVSSLL